MAWNWEEYLFVIDGEEVSFTAREDVNPQLSPLHGMAVRETLAFRPHSSQVRPWKLCHVAARFPWSITSGFCQIDTEGCFENAALVRSRLSGLPYLACFLGEYEQCTMEISSDWEGSLEVARFTWPCSGCCTTASGFDMDPWGQLKVNDQTFHIESVGDLQAAGIDGMVPSETLVWEFRPGCTEDCALLRICNAPLNNLPGPWGDHPWTCTAGGDDCQSSSTQQLSDPRRQGW